MPGQNDPGMEMANSMMGEVLKKQLTSEVSHFEQAMENERTGASTPMPQYESHKRVWALKIEKVHEDEHGQGVALVFENKRFAMRAFTADQLKNRPRPEPGMYMVQYEDGYISFSPGKAFEEGYTPVGPKPRPTIEELEKILNSKDDVQVVVNPDGSIRAL